MHDIKNFPSESDVPTPLRPRKPRSRIVRWSVAIIVAIIVLGWAWSFIAGGMSWRAVFLTNNQVYFGHFWDVPFSSTITLHNVYYLQVSGSAADFSTSTQSQFKLVKLGSEIHGPTDEMTIPVSQVMFWETLRPDSAIVAAIKSLGQ